MAVQGFDMPLFGRVREADVLSGEIGICIDAGAVLVFFADRATSPNGGPA